MNGLAISSLPSTGEMTTSSVPRATMRPSLRYRTLPSSSVLVLAYSFLAQLLHTCHGLFHLIQHKVHQLVVALKRSNDCIQSVHDLRHSSLHPTASALRCPLPTTKLTFPPAAELDGDLLVHVLAQVQDVLFLGPLGLLLPRCVSALCASSSTAPSSTVVAASTASAPKCAAFRHGVRNV
jgi:hypothetical protein